jgi:hypothetical protein
MGTSGMFRFLMSELECHASLCELERISVLALLYQIKSGSGTMISILFWAYKFGFDIDIFARTWNWDYMDQVEENELV